MTEYAIVNKLKARLAGWQTPIEWPEEPFNRIDGQEFVRVQIFPVLEAWAGIGTTKTVETGLIMLTVFVPRFSGTARVSELASALKGLMRSWKDGGLRCDKKPPWIEAGPKQPIWLARIVRKEYEFHECEG